MKDIHTITFDLDDTLWEIHPVIKRAEQRLYAWLGDHYPRITEMYELGEIREIREQVINEMPDQAHDLTFLRRVVLEQIGRAAGYETDFIDAAFDVFDEVRNDVDIFPGVIPALESLREHYVLIAVTNGNANLDKIGIRHLFHDVVTAVTAGAAKPARKIFDAAVLAGGADAGQTLHVGDHPEFDVNGARDAGLKTAWVNRGCEQWPDESEVPDVEVANVGELASLLVDNLGRREL